MNTFTNYARAAAVRDKEAFGSLVQRLSDRFPMLPDVASKVAVYYVKNKIAKLDPYNGVYSVPHGRMLDTDSRFHRQCKTRCETIAKRLNP